MTRRSQLPSLELVDRGEQHRALGRELLGAVGSPAGIRDGRHVVGPEVPLDELPRGIDDDLRPQRSDVEVVEHDHVQAAADWFGVGFHVAHDRRDGARAGTGGRYRDVDEREGADVLRLAVVQELEIILGEIGDEVSALVGHDRVDVDEVHLNLKCRGGRGLLLRERRATARSRRLPSGRRPQGERGHA